MEAKDYLSISVAALALFISLAQILVARNQRRLQDVTSQSAQVSSWNDLREDWSNALLVSSGPDSVRFAGVSAEAIANYRQVLTDYQEAEIVSAREYRKAADSDEWPDMSKVDEELRSAASKLLPYRESVNRVILHLSHVSGLVFRNYLSIESVYNSIGAALLLNRTNVAVMTALPPSASGCPGAYMPEYESWADKSLSEVSLRVGWGEDFAEHQGVLIRARALVDLMVAHALSLGDVTYLMGNQTFAALSRSEIRTSYRIARNVSLRRAVSLTRKVHVASEKWANPRPKFAPKWWASVKYNLTFLFRFPTYRTGVEDFGSDLWIETEVDRNT